MNTTRFDIEIDNDPRYPKAFSVELPTADAREAIQLVRERLELPAEAAVTVSYDPMPGATRGWPDEEVSAPGNDDPEVEGLRTQRVQLHLVLCSALSELDTKVAQLDRACQAAAAESAPGAERVSAYVTGVHELVHGIKKLESRLLDVEEALEILRGGGL